MNRFAVAGLLVVVACGANEELEKKVDTLAAEVAEGRKELDKRLDQLAKEVANAKYLERKLEDLERETKRARDAAIRPAYRPPARLEPDAAQVYAVPLEGAPVIGPADAKVTMVVAFDYGCMYCDRVQPTLADLRRKYGANLRMVFHQQVIHPRNAMVPALASCAANLQGKFAEMDKLLWGAYRAHAYDPERCWDPAGQQLAICPVVAGMAEQLGLRRTKFMADLKPCHGVITDAMRMLSGFAVSATPGFFINGRFMSGARPLDDYARLIDEELAKATARIQLGTPKASYYQKWVLDIGLRRVEPAAAIAAPP